MSEGYAMVAQADDLVLVSDINEIPNAAVLSSLLSDPQWTRALTDATTLVLAGPTFYYHLRCRAAPVESAPEWRTGPRLASGRNLLHFGGGSVRYIATPGAARQPTVVVPHASWHLRYFMSARSMHEAMCRHTAGGHMIDAAQWWVHGAVNASAICASPSLLHHAISNCTDLWARADHGGEYAAVAVQLEEMPRHVGGHPDLFHMAALSRLHELVLD